MIMKYCVSNVKAMSRWKFDKTTLPLHLSPSTVDKYLIVTYLRLVSNLN